MGLLSSAMTYYCGFTPNIKYFEYLRGERMVGEAFEELFGGPVPDNPKARFPNANATWQPRFRRSRKKWCWALRPLLSNRQANGVLSRSGRFDSTWIQPAAGDAGCALDAYCLQQFIHLVTDYILRGRPLPASPESWGKRLYKQSELKPWMEKIRAEEPGHRCFR